jgi:peptide/nickel transport system substrate-binding protein
MRVRRCGGRRFGSGGRLVLVLVAVGLVLAGCGGSSSGKKGGVAASPSSSTTEPLVSTTEVGETSTTLAGAPGTTVASGSVTTVRKASTSNTNSSVTGIKTVTPTTVGGIVQVSAPPSTAAPAVQAQPGGTATVLVDIESVHFDPVKNSGLSLRSGDPHRYIAVYDALLYTDSSTGNVIPQTVESMTTQDAMTWTLKLRPNLKFSDGTSYDAAAVKFEWERCMDPANACLSAAQVKAMTLQVSDPLTLKITLPAVNGQFPRSIDANNWFSYIPSPAAIQAAGSQYSSATPVGAGPFLLKQWVRDSQMTLVRNPNYWQAPRPYLDQLIIKVVGDDKQRSNTFKSGDGQLLFTVDPGIAADIAKSYPVVSVASINTQTLTFNLRRAPFNDFNMRKALELALDNDQVNKTVFAGILETPHSLFPPNYPYSDPTLVYPARNLAEAQQLVDAYVAKNGAGLDINLIYLAAPINDQWAQLVQAQWQQLKNVKVSIKGVSAAVARDSQRAGDFDVATSNYTGADPDPVFFAGVQTGGSRNVGPYSNPAVDKAIADSRAALDSKGRIDALKALQKAYLSDFSMIPLVRNQFFWANQTNMQDVTTYNEGGILWDRLWIRNH